MRIVGGKYGGRTLAVPGGRETRPSSDRVREALFDILAHRFGNPVEGARVLDLFAGTGALGLEALSRGAAYALFVETSAAARGIIRDNIEALGLTGVTRVFRRDATRLGPVGNMAPFDLVFADPPYGERLGERALTSASASGWLAADALAVLEEAASPPAGEIPGLMAVGARRVGASELRFFNAPTAGEASG